MSEDHSVHAKKQRLSLLLWFRIARFFNQSNRMSNEHVKSFDLTISQFDLLVQTQANQPISQMDLASKLLVTKGSITQALVKLEQRDLIQRQQEWRVKRISLTEKGEELLDKALPKQSAFQSSLFSTLTREEQKQLNDLLKKLQKGIESHTNQEGS
ncbi:MarR family winged helix-turn-helix transcriptional regulator [Alkalicoccobacillus murimartini]|jgi:DNA-binding MarR family transcriptional regulator|uniref:DNA-binding MarR family transcriptional regulator n=1 Tax=Alkalicoccobacillus murimartini TaxID=171685 RepID=A0ABT9YE49_9BACI|nr:MarR family transcriptional regulator [Alkalicoccobacillus murimartini]MDQ0206004.1 DNA-binding MarR family transcriptional regulator [Alkalicoccobacillus murimartini]